MSSDTSSPPPQSLLSDKDILRHMVDGTVVVCPFSLSSLNTSSYDVTLGEFYFREALPRPGLGVYNPYSKRDVDRVWGTTPLVAEPLSKWIEESGVPLEGISPDDRVIWIQPGETILAHTNEFIGGRGSVTTMMKARSSMGRNFIEVCKCAGWGDVGYINRWTMEITNNSRHYAIPLVVGRRIAQIVFFDTIGTLAGRSYDEGGKYQSGGNLTELVKGWSPVSCLPKMYLDKDIANGPAPTMLPDLSASASAPTEDNPGVGEVVEGKWFVNGAAAAMQLLRKEEEKQQQ